MSAEATSPTSATEALRDEVEREDRRHRDDQRGAPRSGTASASRRVKVELGTIARWVSMAVGVAGSAGSARSVRAGRVMAGEVDPGERLGDELATRVGRRRGRASAATASP